MCAAPGVDYSKLSSAEVAAYKADMFEAMTQEQAKLVRAAVVLRKYWYKR